MSNRTWTLLWTVDGWCHMHLPKPLNYKGPHKWLCDWVDRQLVGDA